MLVDVVVDLDGLLFDDDGGGGGGGGGNGSGVIFPSLENAALRPDTGNENGKTNLGCYSFVLSGWKVFSKHTLSGPSNCACPMNNNGVISFHFSHPTSDKSWVRWRTSKFLTSATKMGERISCSPNLHVDRSHLFSQSQKNNLVQLKGFV